MTVFVSCEDHSYRLDCFDIYRNDTPIAALSFCPTHLELHDTKQAPEAIKET